MTSEKRDLQLHIFSQSKSLFGWKEKEDLKEMLNVKKSPDSEIHWAGSVQKIVIWHVTS